MYEYANNRFSNCRLILAITSLLSGCVVTVEHTAAAATDRDPARRHEERTGGISASLVAEADLRRIRQVDSIEQQLEGPVRLTPEQDLRCEHMQISVTDPGAGDRGAAE